MAQKIANKKPVKKVQYFKVINPHGHNGVVYQVGLNVDPIARPLDQIGSCRPGAIYFTKKEYLGSFAHYGSMIAWVTASSKVKIDEQGDKWKAHKITITKMLPVEDALPLIYGKDYKALYEAYGNFGKDVPQKVLNSLPIKVQYEIHRGQDSMVKFIKDNAGKKDLYNCISTYYTKNKHKNFQPCEIEFIILNGYPLHKIDLYELSYTYSKKASVRKFIKQSVKDSSAMIILDKLFRNF